jgi:CubicO group peptidase (beta-lactamase class C family)
MRRLLLALAVAASLLVCAPARAQDLVLSRFRDYIESLRTQAGIPGLAAVIVGNNDILWEQAFGRQDLEKSIATRPDTPFHFDGLTQVFTASLVLRCVEEGHLSLDDRVAKFKPDSPEAGATIRELLSHTSGRGDSLSFTYQPERLEPLKTAIRSCGDSFRETLAGLLERLAMVDSVPGPDATHLVPPAEGIPTPAQVVRYTRVLERLAVPYAVDQQRRTSPSTYTDTTLTPASGLVSTVHDAAQFYLALRNGVLLRPDTLAVAWQPPIGSNGQRLPHGLGWFVQSYNGLTVVWQFGVSDGASSSLAVTIPARGLTLILAANSDGLVKPFHLSAGDLTASPYGRVFLSLFAR